MTQPEYREDSDESMKMPRGVGLGVFALLLFSFCLAMFLQVNKSAWNHELVPKKEDFTGNWTVHSKQTGDIILQVMYKDGKKMGKKLVGTNIPILFKLNSSTAMGCLTALAYATIGSLAVLLCCAGCFYVETHGLEYS